MTNENKTDSFILSVETGKAKQKKAKEPAQKEQPTPQTGLPVLNRWYELPYRKMYQGGATNALSEAFVIKNIAQEQLELFQDIQENGISYTQPVRDNTSITFDNITAENPVISWSPGADKTLKCLSIAFAEKIDHKKAHSGIITTDDLIVVLPLRAWANMIGVSTKDMRELKAKARKEVQELYNANLHYEASKLDKVPKDKPFLMSIDTRLLATKAEVSNGNITAQIAPAIAKYWAQFAPKDYPTALLRLNTKNTSYPYTIGNKLYYYLQTKNAHLKKGEKTTTAIISVRKLLETGRQLTLDEQIKEQRKKGELTRRFITPLENALDTLLEGKIITDWCYTRGKRDRVSDKGRKQASFDDLLSMYIEYTMPLPDVIQEQLEQEGVIENT